MFKLSVKNVIVGIGLFVALILAFFPTSYFINKPYIVDTYFNQQRFNEAGIFTITPYEAEKFYSYDQSKCFWIDLRNSEVFSKSHLKAALNQNMNQLENSIWNPDDLILVYGTDTKEAQDAAAFLRQVKNARAFAVEGGFNSVKKYLIAPIGISITNQFSDKDLTNLIEIRSKLSGEKTSADQVLKKLKSSKSKAIREGC
ncbi:MAG: rhodanese-like domain-containing protein [Ignavibacteriaceae bacterium]